MTDNLIDWGRVREILQYMQEYGYGFQPQNAEALFNSATKCPSIMLDLMELWEQYDDSTEKVKIFMLLCSLSHTLDHYTNRVDSLTTTLNHNTFSITACDRAKYNNRRKFDDGSFSFYEAVLTDNLLVPWCYNCIKKKGSCK